jgi:dTDP-4-amino-4,6-dideoxygalactose transaminase
MRGMREVRAGPAKGRAHRIEIPLIDLRLQHRGLQHKMIAAIRQVFDSSIFITGPSVMGFEEEMADFCDTKFAIGVASGTDALMLSLIALGVGPGDEVLLPTFAYAAAAAAICHAGAKPVFVDSIADGFNIDPQDAARRTTRRTRAIIPVHLYGEAAQMDEIMALAGKHGLHVVEDVAQAAGGRWGEQRLGSIGSTGCFSFYPTKNLAGCGDGGMVVTNDEAVASRVRLLRQQADASALGGKKFHHPTVGYNSRLDEVQAAVLRVKLPHLDSWNRLRALHADRYRRLLKEADIDLPATNRKGSHVYCLYTVRHPRRDQLRRHLWEQGIGTEVYYPIPLHLQEAYRGLGYHEGDFPVAERLSQQALSIPVYPELTNEGIDRVARAIADFVGGTAAADSEESDR